MSDSRQDMVSVVWRHKEDENEAGNEMKKAILPGQLTGEMVGKLLDALVDAYRSEAKLAMFLRVELDKRLYQLVSSDELPVMVFHLIEKSEREGWLPDLIQALYEERSGNRKVAAFYQTYHQLLKEQEGEIVVPIEPVVFEKDRLTIPLQGLMGSETGWGHERGARLAEIIQSHIEASPPLIVRLSLQGVERMDVTYAGELVRLVRQERIQRGFCLVDLTDQDLIKNWDAAAMWHRMPLFAWDAEMRVCKLGPDPSTGISETLQYVLSVPRTTTSEVAKALHLKTQNASNKLKQLWTEGFILRQGQSAGSGGIEYEYLRIA
jgi:hypothetical protein